MTNDLSQILHSSQLSNHSIVQLEQPTFVAENRTADKQQMMPTTNDNQLPTNNDGNPGWCQMPASNIDDDEDTAFVYNQWT